MDLGNRISSKRPRVNAAGASAPDWSSLDFDLVGRIADAFLAANDVDYYLSLRAVCRNWRAATVDPRGPDEPRFRLRRWIMLADRAEDSSRLFLNLDTGRFLRRDLPAFRGHISLGTADGLFFSQAPASDGGACILNPFTGYLVQLPLTETFSEHRFSWSPLMLLMFLAACDGESFDHESAIWHGADFLVASPLISAVAFEGCIYTLGRAGSVMVMDRSRWQTDPDDWITTIGGVDSSASLEKLRGGSPHHDWNSFILAFLGSYFVDNGGELLLVSGQYGRVEVYRVDIARKAFVPMKSIGDRAIFLGRRRSLSVRTPAVECNCVYCSCERDDKRVICVYHLEDGRMEELEDPDLGPLSLQQVLIAYCRGSTLPVFC